MNWLIDLLPFRKSYCCGDSARKQRIARKWDKINTPRGLVARPSKRAKEAAEHYMLNTPLVSRLVTHGEAVELQWDKDGDTLILYLHPTDSELDQLHLKSLNTPNLGPNIDKINDILNAN